MIKLDKAVQISIAVTVLLIGFSVFYYYVIFLPKQAKLKMESQYRQQQQKEEQQKEEQQKLEEQHNKDMRLQACIDNTYKNHQSVWDSSCLSLGMGNKCELPAYIADGLLDDLKKEQETCAKLYK